MKSSTEKATYIFKVTNNKHYENKLDTPLSYEVTILHRKHSAYLLVKRFFHDTNSPCLFWYVNFTSK